ncbi:MAG: aminoacyl-tRNA hydrolase [Candidatus Omnitrophica bacterium]|nr:aminoacyl-tRNA hydrolase [Candidatus Omnitrophota bacterium]
MKLIVGLGNPESRYEGTRHNLGFLVLKTLAEAHHLKYKKSAVAQAIETKITLEGVDCSLMMPLTYMNNSGIAVKQWVDKKGLKTKDVLIVCDDLALSFAQMRLRPSGTAGGHHGIKSVIEYLATKDFCRLRLGIGRPHPSLEVADYVLSHFTVGEKKLLPDFINRALTCVTSWVTKGTTATMSQFNGSKDKQ